MFNGFGDEGTKSTFAPLLWLVVYTTDYTVLRYKLQFAMFA